MDQCPVIHKVTDHNGASNGSAPARCPITGMTAAPTNPDYEGADDVNIDDIGTTPSMKEYKKLKKVMAMITRFYQDGSEAKKKNYDTMCEEIAKLEVDEKMAQDQLRALDLKPTFKNHPKQKEYKTNLEDELKGLKVKKEELQTKQKEYLDLYEWSKTIVKVCEWLEASMDDYCSNHLDLPAKLKANIKKPEELSPEQAQIFFKGLDEITYNLQESQDFFAASVDGRLNKYHNIEKEIIQAQLEVLKNYAEDNPRRIYVEAELNADREYVEGNMVENPDAMKRRQKMLKNHTEFCKVLKYHKDKLKLLGVDDIGERHYDPKFDHYK
mmetsp:Transcript_7364/g.10204  ORF Transcript_7364/g.10204 Transcript_7364/m.10204 type:complete len:326 (+) Transcript_7364:96-1073(+)